MYTLGCSGADDVNIVLSRTPAPTIPSSSLSNGVLIQSEILSSLSPIEEWLGMEWSMFNVSMCCTHGINTSYGRYNFSNFTSNLASLKIR